MKIAVLPQDDKSRSKPFYSLLVGLGYTQHILKKNQHFDAKSAQNLHILKKIKKNDRQKSPNLHILKKIKKIKN